MHLSLQGKGFKHIFINYKFNRKYKYRFRRFVNFNINFSWPDQFQIDFACSFKLHYCFNTNANDRY